MDNEILHTSDTEDTEKNPRDAEFVHRIDLDALQREVNMNLKELAEYVNLKNYKGLYKWGVGKDKKGIRPSYNTFVKLFQAGARVETLFGVPYKAAQVVVTEKSRMTDQEILDGMLRAMTAMKEMSQR